MSQNCDINRRIECSLLKAVCDISAPIVQDDMQPTRPYITVLLFVMILVGLLIIPISSEAGPRKGLEDKIQKLRNAGKYREAAEAALALVELYKEDGLAQYVTESYGHVIANYSLANDPANAAKYAEDMGDWFKAFGRDYLDDTDAAYKLSSEYYRDAKNRMKLAEVKIKRGGVLEKSHKTKAAIKQYELAYNIVKGRNEELEKATSYKLKELYGTEGDEFNSKKYDLIHKKLTQEIVETLEKNVDSLQQAERQIQELQASITVDDSTNNQEKIEKVKKQISQLENQKAVLVKNKSAMEEKLKSHEDEISALVLYKENKEIQDEKRVIEDRNRRNLIISSSIIGGLIFLFAIIFAVAQRKVNKRVKGQNAQLEQMNEEANAQNEKLQTQNDKIRKQNEEIEKKNVEIQYQKSELEVEKHKSDELLLNILPVTIAEELKAHDRVDPKTYNMVTVLFTDFKGFTQVAEQLSPQELVMELNACFTAFDDIISRHKLEKIKTIGDAYMCAGGLPEANQTNPVDAILAGIEMQAFMKDRAAAQRNLDQPVFELRLGIHTGPIIAGVVGINKFAYDIWGDAVNTASRMESSGEPGKVNISGVTQALTENYFHFTYRGKIQAKNKGAVDMYFVDGIKE